LFSVHGYYFLNHSGAYTYSAIQIFIEIKHFGVVGRLTTFFQSSENLESVVCLLLLTGHFL